LNEGAFGKVYKGKCRGKEVAIKVPSRQNLTKEELEAFRHEVQIMRKLFHPNILLCLGACTTEKSLMYAIFLSLSPSQFTAIAH
jgi:serine/threonine protein kinase